MRFTKRKCVWRKKGGNNRGYMRKCYIEYVISNDIESEGRN
jgi:hypothetical protein